MAIVRSVEALDDVIQATEFSGVVCVDDASGTVIDRAAGCADRRHGIANTPVHRFAAASAAKGFTALAVSP